MSPLFRGSAFPTCQFFLLILSIQFNSIQFNSIQFNSIQFNSIQFNSIQYIRFNSTQFNSTQINSIPLAINKGYPEVKLYTRNCNDQIDTLQEWPNYLGRQGRKLLQYGKNYSTGHCTWYHKSSKKGLINSASWD